MFFEYLQEYKGRWDAFTVESAAPTNLKYRCVDLLILSLRVSSITR
jgi:hypothetical protein